MLKRHTIERMKDGHLVQHYLLASLCYYIHHESPMTDDAFDRLCVLLLERFDRIEHPHKYLIDKGMLEAGTGFYLREEDYPNLIRHSANTYTARCLSGELEKAIEQYLNPPSQGELF